MQKVIWFILIGVFSCGKERKTVGLPAPVTAQASWVVYEGRVPVNENTNLYVELSILPGNLAGEGSFILKELLEADDVSTPVSSFKGKYSTLYGEVPSEAVIQLHNTSHAEGFRRTYQTTVRSGSATTKIIREEAFRNTDLAVRATGNNRLLVLDKHLKPVSAGSEFNLDRRTSPLFTLEGYFRHNGDTAEFHEMNTRETWAVTKLGAYYNAIRQYHLLTKDKFEVTYIKATGFSVRHTDEKGMPIDALVIKKVLQMTASPTLTEEYKMANP